MRIPLRIASEATFERGADPAGRAAYGRRWPAASRRGPGPAAGVRRRAGDRARRAEAAGPVRRAGHVRRHGGRARGADRPDLGRGRPDDRRREPAHLRLRAPPDLVRARRSSGRRRLRLPAAAGAGRPGPEPRRAARGPGTHGPRQRRPAERDRRLGLRAGLVARRPAARSVAGAVRRRAACPAGEHAVADVGGPDRADDRRRRGRALGGPRGGGRRAGAPCAGASVRRATALGADDGAASQWPYRRCPGAVPDAAPGAGRGVGHRAGGIDARRADGDPGAGSAKPERRPYQGAAADRHRGCPAHRSGATPPRQRLVRRTRRRGPAGTGVRAGGRRLVLARGDGGRRRRYRKDHADGAVRAPAALGVPGRPGLHQPARLRPDASGAHALSGTAPAAGLAGRLDGPGRARAAGRAVAQHRGRPADGGRWTTRARPNRSRICCRAPDPAS